MRKKTLPTAPHFSPPVTGHLVISAKVFAGELLIEISDDGPGCELTNGQVPESNGVGLSNTRERLATI